MTKTRMIGLLVALFVFLIDQGTKWCVTGPLNLYYEGARRELLPFFDLRYVENNGVSLGLLEANSDLTRWALVALTGAIAIGVFLWLWRERMTGEAVGLGLVLGGALGNILDRTRLGFVVDFADFHIGSWRPFLVFNVADAAITIGVAVLLIRAFFKRDTPSSRRSGMENNLNA